MKYFRTDVHIFINGFPVIPLSFHFPAPCVCLIHTKEIWLHGYTSPNASIWGLIRGWTSNEDFYRSLSISLSLTRDNSQRLHFSYEWDETNELALVGVNIFCSCPLSISAAAATSSSESLDDRFLILRVPRWGSRQIDTLVWSACN